MTASLLQELIDVAGAALDDASLSTDRSRAEAMAPAMGRLIGDPASVPAWAGEPFEGGAVGNLLYADPDGRFHVLAVVFPEGTSSGVHFHGCWGVIGYLRGGDEETRYAADGDDGVPVEVSRRSWQEGDIAYLLPEEGEGWHRVRNPGPGVGVSIHILCLTPAEHPHLYWDRDGRRALSFPFVEVAPDRWVARVEGLPS
jgi:predicted metal-dependent enzyme (double-stranded beta helix superfamily)